MIKHSKPKSFYDTFERKSYDQKVPHYCPGCGHGVIHKLLAEAIDDLQIQDKTVMISPVGCSAFLHFYFDVAHVQASHGRAPATGTGVSRVLDDSVVICYQGDGDLAAIGTAEIIHAANRGESMLVVFVNNSIYGMTGGQMAPTTLLDQVTSTTPHGRDKDRDGMPIKMCDIINQMDAPVFIERVTLSTPANVLKARKALRKGLLNQKERKGFSFIEVLSPCPINLGGTPVDSRKWIKETLEVVYPPKNFRDIDNGVKGTGRMKYMQDAELLELEGIFKNEEAELLTPRRLKEHSVKIAGFGGQAILSGGVLMSKCAVYEGLHTTWIPSYGAEMRGGTAYASVIISSDSIGSPTVDFPDTLIVMNSPSLDKFENDVKPGGLIIVNSSLVTRKVIRKDVNAYYIPVSDLANDLGLIAVAMVIMLAVYAKLTECIQLDVLKKVLPATLKKKSHAELNLKAIEIGEKYLIANPLK